MDRVNGGTSHVPAFLGKLWRLVDEPSTNDLICWSESGKSFIIRNQSKFARELLPLYYKHNNMASFVRQLNMYGFHKVISVEQGGLRLDRDEMEFAHAYFVQGNEDALEFIKRKISTAKIEDVKGRPESLNKVLMDVRQMKGRQEAMDSKLVAVKRENEALWRELSQLRQKHSKQQQIVSKLLQFLVSMMSSQSHRISFKRRMPLMLNDVDDITKPAKISRQNANSVEETAVEASNGPVIHEVFEAEEPMLILNPHGEAVKEDGETHGVNCTETLKVDDLLNKAVSETIGEDSLEPTSPFTEEADRFQAPETNNHESMDPNSPYVADLLSIQTMDSNSESPLPPAKTEEAGAVFSGTGLETDIEGLPSLEDSMQLCRTQEHPTSNAIAKPNVILPDDFDGHLDDVQLGLDSLKDLLQGSSYNIDGATLSGVGSPAYSFDTDTLRQLFGIGTHENDLPLYELTQVDEGAKEKKVGKDVPLGITFGNGSETLSDHATDLVSYNPCLFELVEDDSQFLDTPDNIFLDDELDLMLTTDRNKLNEN